MYACPKGTREVMYQITARYDHVPKISFYKCISINTRDR